MTSPPKKTKWHDPIVILTAGLVFLAAVQAVILLIQADILRQQASILRNDQRAWVGPARIEGPSGDVLDLGAKVYIRNFGKSPALRMDQRLNNILRPREEPFEAEYGDAKSLSIGVLLPSEEQIGFFPSHKWKQEEIEAVTSGRSVLYRFGEVTYDDVFGKRHRTTFGDRLVYRESVPKGWAWQVLDTYNAAD